MTKSLESHSMAVERAKHHHKAIYVDLVYLPKIRPNPHSVASVLKVCFALHFSLSLFFQSLIFVSQRYLHDTLDPVLPNNKWDQLFSVSTNPPQPPDPASYITIFNSLQPNQLALALYLFRIFHEIQEKESNMMTAHKLATSLAPTLIRPGDIDARLLLDNCDIKVVRRFYF